MYEENEPKKKTKKTKVTHEKKFFKDVKNKKEKET